MWVVFQKSIRQHLILNTRQNLADFPFNAVRVSALLGALAPETLSTRFHPNVALLIDAPSGRTNDVLDSETPNFWRQTCIVVARLALLLPVERAID